MNNVSLSSPLVEGAEIFGPRGRMVKFLRATPSSTKEAWAINATIRGEPCHWWDGHTEPCLARYGKCPMCGPKSPPRWYGYLACLNKYDGRIWLAEIPYGAASNCEYLQSGVESLRGMFFTLRRRGAGTRSPVCIEFSDRKYPHQLPKPIDTQATLERTWGLDLGETAPLPRAVEGGTR